MKILIADDSAMIRRGVRGVLSSSSVYEVCGEADNGEDAIAKAKQLQPDLILLDIRMPGANGFQAAAAIRREAPTTKIIIMSQHDEAHLLPRALEAGADACIDKDSLGMELLPTIRRLTETPGVPGAAKSD